LLAGRFDILIAGENVMIYKIKEMGVASEVINVGLTNISGNLYGAFSPNNGSLRVNPWSHENTRLRLRLRRGYPPNMGGDITPQLFIHQSFLHSSTGMPVVFCEGG
jgi:hypothetical protein